ncbi:hypothetical protein Pla52n_43870 [Stieleria varia]|uniref:Uncharacterized protein n=1 Tax=Stieleria varia TaxID=2528005 RepID=A0A5C6APH4_9BACT|nr:hypothetical protein Pla52n_43870 [Stieleria varia]
MANSIFGIACIFIRRTLPVTEYGQLSFHL